MPGQSTAELRRLVREEPSSIDARAALDELAARAPRGLDRLLRDVALDEQAGQPLRLQAIAALGRRPTRASLDALRAAIDGGEAEVEQLAIERLGKVGTVDDLDRLRRVRTGNRTTQRVLRTAKSFLSYRHRLGTYRIDEPKHPLAADTGTAAPIRTTTPTSKMLDRIERVAASVPGFALVPTPLRRLVCGGDEYALMWNAALSGVAAATLADRQGIPAVLLRYHYETGAYSPAYYFFADPSRGGRLRIVGLRGSGRVGLVGRAEIDAEALRFEVNATDAPIEHPLTLTGSYNLGSGTIRFDVSVVESRFNVRQQRRRNQPRRVRRPA